MASNAVEWALSQSDNLLGLACAAVLATMPRLLTPDVVNYEIDELGALVPEWGAADARKTPTLTLPMQKKKQDVSAPPTAPVA